MYDKSEPKSYPVPQVFILQDYNTLRWENKKVDLSPVTNSPEAIAASGKTTAYMPLPTQIDQCVNAELANDPTQRGANGTVKYLALRCAQSAEMSGNEVPTDVSVTISRMTGELTIRRRQDGNSQHDTLHDGSCIVFKPLF